MHVCICIYVYVYMYIYIYYQGRCIPSACAASHSPPPHTYPYMPLHARGMCGRSVRSHAYVYTLTPIVHSRRVIACTLGVLSHAL